MNTNPSLYRPMVLVQGSKNRHKRFITCFHIIHRIVVVISIYLLFGMLFQQVYADVNKVMTDPYQSRHGAVLLRDSTDQNNHHYSEALQMQTDVNIEISGPIARTTVRQQFKNSSELWLEGIYVFPLPEKSAVDRFKIIIGDRILEGQIKERRAASIIYQQARAAGKKTGLIEQQRANVFSTELANIAPGENISIEFEYQQLLDYREQQYHLRFPMTIGERYKPHAGNNSTRDDDTRDPDVITRRNEQAGSNPTRIHILLDAGVSLSQLDSRYHKINIKQTSESRYSISTIGENINSDRDFELVWQPQLINAPQLAGFKQTVNGEHYTLLSILPPQPDDGQQPIRARDVVFVLDISGSMAGTSIAQAKAAMITALNRLRSIDRFNVIWFNDKTGSLFPRMMPADRQTIKAASKQVKRLEAAGGTEMLNALQQALANQQQYGRLRQIIFVTDGHISNEQQLLRTIDQRLGNSRLFTIGIGSAPNHYFMRKAAHKGRGSFTYIGDINEVREKTEQLLHKLENPALTNINIDIDRSRYQVFPDIIPDLYAGDTATVLIKGPLPLQQTLNVSGDYGNSEWNTQLLPGGTEHSGINIAWAREKLDSLMTMYHETDSQHSRESIKQSVIATAMEHHLLSRFTSLAAVDVSPVNIEGLLHQQRMFNNLPHGWKQSQAAKIMLAQTATASGFNLRLGLLLLFFGVMLYRWHPAPAF